MMSGDGEMPGGSGSAQDPGTSAGGEGEGKPTQMYLLFVSECMPWRP